MRVIICGAGQVGYSIAASLAREENDVTIIDNDPRLIDEINSNMDAKGIVGHASSPDILKTAGANGTDLIIAVTSSDEVNMVACQIGHSLFGIPKKIARIRQQVYLQPEWSNLFSRTHMPIDVTISPELVVAKSIVQRLSVPGTTYVAELAGGLAYMIGVVCGNDCPVVDTPLGQLEVLFPELSLRVLSILRNRKHILPTKEDQLRVGDECFFIVDAPHLQRAMSIFGNEEKSAQRIVIAGGGHIGFGLARLLLEKNPSLRIKLIERNDGRAQFLSENLPEAITLHGSALDKDILDDAAIDNVETFIAVTNDDESNILGSILAKRYGCKRAIALVNNNVYSPLVGSFGIDAIVSPGATVIASIMQHVRRGRMKRMHNLHDGFLEVVEAEVSEASVIANQSIGELELPENVVIAAYVKDGELHMPKESDVLKADDLVIIMNTREQSHEVEKLFSVQVDLF